MKWFMYCVSIILLLGLLSGCTNSLNNESTANQAPNHSESRPAQTDETAAEEPAEDVAKEPVELTIWFTSSVPQSDEAFDEMYRNLIEAKFPHITLHFLPYNSENTFQNLIVTNQPIDLIVSSIGQTAGFVLAHDLHYDISELIKQHDYDLSLVEPSTIEIQRQISGGGIYGLPMSTDTMTLFYNRDLFDLFGAAYPPDGLTWEDTYEIIQRMSRTEDGVRYWGMGISPNHALQLDPLSPPFIDEQNKAAFENERYKRALETLVQIFNISGNEVDASNWSYGTHLSMFQIEKTMAMLLGTSALGYAYFGDNEDLNWDVAAYPRYADQPDIGPQTYPVYFYVSSISKHKDEAFQVAAYITTKQFQTHLAGYGVLPISSDPTVMDHYGNLLPYMADKNIDAFLPNTFAPPSYKGEFHSIGVSASQEAFRKVVLKETDINTALREAVEMAEQLIAERLGSN